MTKKKKKYNNSIRKIAKKINPVVIEWNKRERGYKKPMDEWQLDLLKLVRKNETKWFGDLQTKVYTNKKKYNRTHKHKKREQ